MRNHKSDRAEWQNNVNVFILFRKNKSHTAILGLKFELTWDHQHFQIASWLSSSTLEPQQHYMLSPHSYIATAESKSFNYFNFSYIRGRSLNFKRDIKKEKNIFRFETKYIYNPDVFVSEQLRVQSKERRTYLLQICEKGFLKHLHYLTLKNLMIHLKMHIKNTSINDWIELFG